MCRIHGYLGGPPLDREALLAMGRAQRHGGPDAQTLWTSPAAALGNNRLAVQGVDDGEQPYRRGGLTCVFNGEVYNHRTLREQLRSKGFAIEGDCDGNVLLPLYELYGDAFVDHLEGMYAIAVVDQRAEPELALYNDPTGMKSLYYYLSADGSRLAFASELQALSRLPDFPHQLDPLAVDRYLGGKAVWGPTTVYRSVQTMAPGTTIRFSRKGLRVTRAEPSRELPGADQDSTRAARTLDALVQAELARMVDADVPVCVVTSGGLDSSYLTAVAATLVPRLASFNIAYAGDWPSDERGHATDVAAHCGTEHHQVLVDPAAFPDLVHRFVRHLDQPNNAPHSLSTFALFEAIHDSGYKVALTGDGADELFSGYARYGKAAADLSPHWQRSYQDTMAAVPTSQLGSLYTAAYRAEIQRAGGFFTDRSGTDLAQRVAASPLSKLETVLRYDQYERFPYYILRRVDHLSMAHAVEARIPFLQPSIVGLAHSLPPQVKVVGSQVKAPVALAAAPWLPSSIIDRPKQPFTLPIAAMMRPGQALHDLVGDVLLQPGRRCADLIDQVALDTLFRSQSQAPDARAAEALWSVLVLELWLGARGLTP